MSGLPRPRPGQNPHDILGVRPDASDTEITHAYRRLIRQHHPDTAPGHTDLDRHRLQQVLAAYQQLRHRRQPTAQPGTAVPVTVHHYDGPATQAHPADRRQNHNRVWLGDHGPETGTRPSRRIPIARPGTDTTAAVTITADQARTGTVLTVAAPTDLATGELRNIHVRIPPGTRNGQTLRVTGQGTPGPAGGRAGDLHLTVYHANPAR